MKRQQLLLLGALFIFYSKAYGISFFNLAQKFKGHESVEILAYKGLREKFSAENEGSWGDPTLTVAAKNFPKDSLKEDQTPMTGLEFKVSQKIALTTKYRNLKNAKLANSHALDFLAQRQKQYLIKKLWEQVILRRKIVAKIKIIKENINWIKKILKVSRRLYANGKTSQLALLELQIRKTELKSLLSNNQFELKKLQDNFSYLIGNDRESLDYKSIPWEVLESKNKNKNENKKGKDFKELALQEKLKSRKLLLQASRLNYIPDLTFSLGYTKRSNIDRKGDFVSAAISFPLPFSSKKYTGKQKAISEKSSVQKEYRHYLQKRKQEISLLTKEIKKITAEINILDKKTIKFSAQSRAVIAKSYRHGRSSYLELLQSELKFQNILLKKIALIAKKDMNKITLKYIIGEPLL